MPTAPTNDNLIQLTIMMLLLWLILEVTEALEKLKKLLEALQNIKYTLCNMYCNIIYMLLSYYADQTETGRGGRGRGGGGGYRNYFISSIYLIVSYIIINIITSFYHSFLLNMGNLDTLSHMPFTREILQVYLNKHLTAALSTSNKLISTLEIRKYINIGQ